MGYEKEAYLYLYIIQENNIFKRAQSPKTHLLILVPISFWAVGYHSPQLAFHIYYVKYDNTITCKMISWKSGEWCFKNNFLFPICIIQNVTILAPK